MQIKLDFTLNGSTARMEYINNYLKNIDQNRLTEDNKEMISNYILWGLQNEGTELDFEIESKNSPWSKGRTVASLEAMAEQEQETGMPVQVQMSDVQMNQVKRKLDRADVVQKLKGNRGFSNYEEIAWAMVKDPSLDCFTILVTREEINKILDSQGNVNYTLTADEAFSIRNWHPLTNSWFLLWNQIDSLEFMVQNWELDHGKRRADLPIRDELHFRLACYLLYSGRYGSLEKYEDELREVQKHWEGYKYLKNKRYLVQLRTQQYSLLDCIQGETLMHHINNAMYWSEAEIGIRDFYPFSRKDLLIDGVQEEHFNQKFYDTCIAALQKIDKIDSGNAKKDPLSIDLRDIETVRQLILFYPDLEEAAQRFSEVEGDALRNLLNYLAYYIKQCNFDPELNLILTAKMHKYSNKDIVNLLEIKFGLSYKENYISTIFTKRIVEAIVEQVNLHYRLIEFITMGSSVFKRCTKCGKLLPRNTTYFNRRTSTSDGFFSSCKKCKTRRK